MLSGGSGADMLSGDDGDDRIEGGDGNDTLQGNDDDDILIGGPGNDVLQGGSETDTFVYNLGDGDDILWDSSFDSSPDETLILGAGIAPAALLFSRVAADWDDIRISFAGLAGSIILDEQNRNNAGVEILIFADGTIWDEATLLARYVSDQQTAAADTIHGTNFGDVVEAGGGNDIVVSGDGADTLIGGAGNDILQGGSELDTYVYNPGDGDDVIWDSSYDSSGAETLLLGESIAPADVVFSKVTNDWDDIRISFAGLAGSIIFDEQHRNNAGIEAIQFADGTVWDQAGIHARYIAAQQTAGADTIYGTELDDLVAAAGGNDNVTTGDGDDTLGGGTGNDTLQGGSGADTYVYGLGDGDDVLYDSSYDSSPDEILVLGQGITAADLVFTRSTADADDLIVTFAAFAGSIVLDEQYKNSGIEIIRFFDGTTLTEAQFMI